MTRLEVFNQYLVETLGIPVIGISPGANPPTTCVITYAPEATQEQIDEAEQAVDLFDWRPRRLLTRAQIVAALQSLTAQQRDTLQRHLLIHLLRQSESEVLRILSDTGIPLAFDEVDPNPT